MTAFDSKAGAGRDRNLHRDLGRHRATACNGRLAAGTVTLIDLIGSGTQADTHHCTHGPFDYGIVEGQHPDLPPLVVIGPSTYSPNSSCGSSGNGPQKAS